MNVPVGVSLPTLFPWLSLNHRLPSEPPVIPTGPLLAVGMANSVMTPLIVIRPTLLPST